MPIGKRTIELLSPAKDLDTARAAIDHGADAVYIGGPDFSARKAAGNSVEDIAVLCQYAHRYRARVYITRNTILGDSELPAAQKLIRDLHTAGADALIVQDMGILEMDLPPIELHASTQAHIDSPEKADFLYRAGFSRVVVARELPLDGIADIAQNTDAEIEAFIHGALCVSYSGQCYLSQAFTGRSANRGNCAQICRLPFDVFDPAGNLLRKGAHMLSLKDMNRTDSLEGLIDAGVTSFKIEGRLKDTAYVKNVTAWYRQALDGIIARRDDLMRLSDGITRTTFRPDPSRSFNRGFTDYLPSARRTEDPSNPATPKSLGQPIGKIKSVSRDSLTADSPEEFSAGDGFVFLRPDGTSGGFNINRAEGSWLFPFKMPDVRPGDLLFRNSDAALSRVLSAKSAERKVTVDFHLSETPEGYRLSVSDKNGFLASVDIPAEHTPAKTPQRERITAALSKLGDTEFEAGTITIDLPGEHFIPLSAVADLRRSAIDSLRITRTEDVLSRRNIRPIGHPPVPASLDTDYRLNVSNHLARRFYEGCGVKSPAPAFELAQTPNARLAVCRHCLKYSLGRCLRYGGKNGKDLPYLVLKSGNISLRAEFDCHHCRMELFKIL